MLLKAATEGVCIMPFRAIRKKTVQDDFCTFSETAFMVSSSHVCGGIVFSLALGFFGFHLGLSMGILPRRFLGKKF